MSTVKKSQEKSEFQCDLRKRFHDKTGCMSPFFLNRLSRRLIVWWDTCMDNFLSSSLMRLVPQSGFSFFIFKINILISAESGGLLGLRFL
jgi:hypothetical protein